MSEPNRKLPPELHDVSKPKREYADPEKSERKGVGGLVETILRRFKNLTHVVMILPIFVLGFLTLGTAIGAGLAAFDFISGFGQELPRILRYVVTGTAAAAGY